MSKLSFNNKNDLFFKSVKNSVENYFIANNLKKTGNWKLYSKTIILFISVLVVYLYLVFAPYSVILGILLSITLGVIMAAIAFNVMHDACHGSFSSRKWINETMGLTMNALGSISYFWKISHNIIHHTYTNVDGIDDDIGKSPLMRMCPSQRWVPAHRFQFIYIFLIYPFYIFGMVMVFDFIKYFSKRIRLKIPLREHYIFWLTKILYIVFYALIPIVYVGWHTWLIGFMLMQSTMGTISGIVFMLAHVVEKTSFETAGEEPKMLDSQWAMHQVLTTADFAQKNKIVTWFVGGLNYQIEHHLFPRVSHIHYPELSRIVKANCKKFNLPYHCYPTTRAAIASHIRLMKQLGKKEFSGLYD